MAEFEFRKRTFSFGRAIGNKYSYKVRRGDITRSQADSYLKKGKDSFAYVGSLQGDSGYTIEYTKDKKYFVNIRNKRSNTNRKFKEFDGVLNFLAGNIKKDKITVKLIIQ